MFFVLFHFQIYLKNQFLSKVAIINKKLHVYVTFMDLKGDPDNI